MNKKIKQTIGSVKLIILDGWGYSPPWGGNAISQARTPNFNWAWRKFPHTLLEASGKHVGLPGHEMGNSEVGHLTLGAGRIIPQDISRINKAIEDESFFNNQQIIKAIDHQKKNSSKLQIIGLLSSGGIHSHIDHFFALLKIIKDRQINNVYLHLITDGRDSPPRSAQTFINRLIKEVKRMGLANSVKIATISGRYYGMDRNNTLKRTNLAYQAMTANRGKKSDSALTAISKSYRSGVTDQYIIPTVIEQSGVIEDGDSVIFLNFRSDRARQLTSFFIDPELSFRREKELRDLYFVSMVPYQAYDQQLPYHSAFPTKKVDSSLAKILADNNLKQFHVAETEKYAHVTYFFNGMIEEPYRNEDRTLVPSPNVDTYDQKPEMSAKKVCNEILKAQKSNKYQFVLANFANPDMVAHSGNLAATIKAVEAVDQQLGRIFENIQKDETILITADHGNAEEMIDSKTGDKNTEHTNNPVPFILIDHNKESLQSGRSIGGVANLILDQLNIDVPEVMKKESIFN